MKLESIHNYLPLTERIATAGQPKEKEFAWLKEAGFEVVINLLPDSQVMAEESRLVPALGMEYIRIPVAWNAPEIAEAEQFFAEMEAHAANKIFVHCAANMRVSAFLYLYRVCCLKMSVEAAATDLHRIWTPNPVWQDFMDSVILNHKGEA